MTSQIISILNSTHPKTGRKTHKKAEKENEIKTFPLKIAFILDTFGKTRDNFDSFEMKHSVRRSGDPERTKLMVTGTMSPQT